MNSLSLDPSINTPLSDLSSKHFMYPATMVDFGVMLGFPVVSLSFWNGRQSQKKGMRGFVLLVSKCLAHFLVNELRCYDPRTNGVDCDVLPLDPH